MEDGTAVSRDQFEKWFHERYGYLGCDAFEAMQDKLDETHRYAHVATQACWEAWKASREALS